MSPLHETQAPAPTFSSSTTCGSGGIVSIQARKRRRAAKACLSCRARKVRCNAIQQSPNPCINCQLDGTACVVPRKSQPPWSQSSTQPPILPTVMRPLSKGASSDYANGSAVCQSSNSCDRPAATSLPSAEGAGGSSASEFSATGVFPDLDFSDLLVSCSPPMQPVPGAINMSSNFNPIEISIPESNLDFPDWPTEYDFSATQPFDCYDSFSAASTNMENYPPIMDMSPPENSSQLNEVCTCIPLCRSPFPWIATWCIQALDESARSMVIRSEALFVPPLEIIQSLFESYFVHLNTTTPCISEWDTYRLLNESLSEDREHPPLMSLALLNTIMFAASGLVTVQLAQEAGFSDIGQMRTKFYVRAKVLYDAGCEKKNIDRFRVCLLLSNHHCHPMVNHESGSWLLEAQKILVQANITRHFTCPSWGEREMRWKVLYSIYIIRVCTLILGARSPRAPIELPTMVPKIHLEDLDDLSCTWFLDSATKRKGAAIFLAYQSITLFSLRLCQLRRRSMEVFSPSLEAEGIDNGSIMGELEQMESHLTGWRIEHEDLFKDEPWPTVPGMGETCVLAMQASLKLSYEYILSSLHQLNLLSERTRISTWTVALLETSRKVIEESTSTTIGILRDLVRKNAVHFLQDTITVCLRSCSCSTVKIVHNLSTCYTVLQIFAERYEIVDYYQQLNEMCAGLAHERLLRDGIAYTPDRTDLRNMSPKSANGNASITPLPPVEIYSTVLRALERCFVRGLTDPLSPRHTLAILAS